MFLFLLSPAEMALCRSDHHKSFITVFEMLKGSFWVSVNLKGGWEAIRQGTAICLLFLFSSLIDCEDHGSHELLGDK